MFIWALGHLYEPCFYTDKYTVLTWVDTVRESILLKTHGLKRIFSAPHYQNNAKSILVVH